MLKTQAWSHCLQQERVCRRNTYWLEAYKDGNPPVFLNDTMVGGKTYSAVVILPAPKFGYNYDSASAPKINVKNADEGSAKFIGGAIIFNVTPEHDWGEWKTTKEPTTTAKGEEQRQCKHCDETETRELPELEEYSLRALRPVMQRISWDG